MRRILILILISLMAPTLQAETESVDPADVQWSADSIVKDKKDRSDACRLAEALLPEEGRSTCAALTSSRTATSRLIPIHATSPASK
ncbi:MAG: hypothetical protein AB7G93_22625 [Bdellovibrionales bacterium]